MSREPLFRFFLAGPAGLQPFHLTSPLSPGECERRLNAVVAGKNLTQRIFSGAPVLGSASGNRIRLRRTARPISPAAELDAALIPAPDGSFITGSIVVSPFLQAVLVIGSMAVLVTSIGFLMSLSVSLATGKVPWGDVWPQLLVPAGMGGFTLLFRQAGIHSLATSAEFFRSYLLHALEAR